MRSRSSLQRGLLRLPAAALATLFALVASLAGAPAASAATMTLSANPTAPVVGQTVTFTAQTPRGCNQFTWVFTVDGQTHGPTTVNSAGAGDTATLDTSFATAGDHTVSVTAANGDCGSYASDPLTITVYAALGGTITSDPDPPIATQQTSVRVATTGGVPTYTYAWDSDDDGQFNDGTTSHITPTFATTGPHVVRVRITDSGSPQNTTVVSRTLNVVAPTGPPPPPPPPCVKKLDFAISEFTTDGCFTKASTSPEQWTTTDRVKLNGIPFADTGNKFIITFPTPAEPGGHVTSTSGTIELDRFIPFSGPIDWSLPAGNQGDEGTLKEVSVPSSAELFKLRVAGSIAIRIGWDANGKHYATFPLNVELPPAFTAGPSRFAGGVSGTASVRVDDAGIHFDGLKISVTDVWIGRLKVPQACFSYVPAGGQAVSPCEAPSLDGEPYVTCSDDVTTDRWDGNAVIELPTPSETQLAAFGGLADGSISKLGGFADNLGTTVPLMPGIFLNRVGLGLCLKPPPFKLRGDVGVNALGGRLTVNGHILYTDTDESARQPWSVEMGGNVAMEGTQLGSGSVTVNAWGDVDFDLQAGIDLKDIVTLDGEIGGWIEPRNSTFNITGSLKGCLLDLPCATALGLISSSGVAGCVDAGSITVPVPENVREGPLGFGSIVFETRNETIYLQAGFGYRYGSGTVDLLGNSCDLSPYEATKASVARAAGGPLVQVIRPGTKAIALKIKGTHGPPKIVIKGPGGTRIVSPRKRKAAQVKGRYILAENRTDGTTNVLLVKPKAGRWTITGVRGAKSRPEQIIPSLFQAPSVLLGQQRSRAGGVREVVVGYAVPAGTSVALVERGKGVARTLSKRLRGKRCRGTKALPDGRRLLCARLRFSPSAGPGGRRTLVAIVSRHGIPITRKVVASFRAAAPAPPARPGALRARRSGTALVVAFPATRGAARYTVSATLSDGRKLGYYLRESCRAVRIAHVASGTSAIVQIAGVSPDLRVGAYRRLTVASNARRIGSQRKFPRRACS